MNSRNEVFLETIIGALYLTGFFVGMLLFVKAIRSSAFGARFTEEMSKKHRR